MLGVNIISDYIYIAKYREIFISRNIHGANYRPSWNYRSS